MEAFFVGSQPDFKEGAIDLCVDNCNDGFHLGKVFSEITREHEATHGTRPDGRKFIRLPLNKRLINA